MKTVMNLRAPQNAGNSLTERLLASQERPRYRELVC